MLVVTYSSDEDYNVFIGVYSDLTKAKKGIINFFKIENSNFYHHRGYIIANKYDYQLKQKIKEDWILTVTDLPRQFWTTTYEITIKEVIIDENADIVIEERVFSKNDEKLLDLAKNKPEKYKIIIATNPKDGFSQSWLAEITIGMTEEDVKFIKYFEMASSKLHEILNQSDCYSSIKPIELSQTRW